MRAAVAATCISLALVSTAYGQSIAACPSIAPSCQAVDAAPKPKQKCGTPGRLGKLKATSDELVIPVCTAASEDDCRKLCAEISSLYDYDTSNYYPSCQSLSFDRSTSTCSLWLQKLNALGFKAKPASNVVHYSSQCYSLYTSSRVLGYTGDYADWFYTGKNIPDPSGRAGAPIDTISYTNDISDTCSVVEACRESAKSQGASMILVGYDNSAAVWQCSLYQVYGTVPESEFTISQTQFSEVYGYYIPLPP